MNKNLLRKIELLYPRQTEIINQYKRQDVFRCAHETHVHFDNAVSVYHVLKTKKCYPEGCISYKWRCKKLHRGESCHRKYKHVGRTCFQCKYYYDIKVIKRPEITLSQAEFQQFQKDLKLFESWLMQHQGRLVAFSGKVNSVKPRYSLQAASHRAHVRYEGFMLNFLEGAVTTQYFHDFVYVSISSRLQSKYRFAKGDSVSFSGYFTLQQGSIVLQKIRSIELHDRGEPCFWTESRARVAQRTGAVLKYQSKTCYACDRGVLLAITSPNTSEKGLPRRMFCLEGIENPQECCYRIHKTLRLNECPPDNGAMR